MPTKMVGNYKFRTFDPPPTGFDPVQAPHSKLLHHGFPARPDHAKEPQVFLRWKKAMSLYRDLKFTYISPEFVELPDTNQGLYESGGPDLPDGSRVSLNWSGAMVFVDPSKDRLQAISGQWTVPNAYRPIPESAANYFSSAWIGIDGASDGLSGSTDVLQAGTVTQLRGGLLQCFAFIQWFPYSKVMVSLPVAPGDAVSLVICITDFFADPTPTAFCSLGNLTSRQYAPFEVSGPTTSPPVRPLIIGNCAEAVVERPSALPVVDYRLKLPRYGEVFFDAVMAGTSLGTAHNIGAGVPITMVEDDLKTVISKTEVLNADALRVYYAGP